ncbi:MAG TPA: hypothetical protein VG603_16015 [Chitinophagales bacterium]|nr:hypothetical protein [Chitinophagales bacterium]
MKNILNKTPFLLPALLLWAFAANAQHVKFDDWKNLTTSGKLPPECHIQRSNNNLDVVKYNGRYYLAFRTAPTHFPSRKAVMYVISSPDLDNWTYETEINVGRDLREPKFAVYHDTLNLYCFTGSKSMFSFDPQQILVCRTIGGNFWTNPESVNLDGFVPWRVRERSDTLYMSAYYGKGLYTNGHKSDLRLFYSTDAMNWTPISKDPQVDVLSAEEGEFIFDKTGNLYATVRLEGTGALICKADKCCIGNWKKVRTKDKYDSALLFNHANDIYLVSRRNLDGPVDKLDHRTSETKRRMRNLIRYSITRKVTSLFRLNKDSLTLSLVTDFPSTGDTAFPGMVKLDDNTYLLMNYSSNITGRKKSWIAGQLGKTYIYWTKLKFNNN